jgi:hypothetical protein
MGLQVRGGRRSASYVSIELAEQQNEAHKYRLVYAWVRTDSRKGRALSTRKGCTVLKWGVIGGGQTLKIELQRKQSPGKAACFWRVLFHNDTVCMQF